MVVSGGMGWSPRRSRALLRLSSPDKNPCKRRRRLHRTSRLHSPSANNRNLAHISRCKRPIRGIQPRSLRRRTHHTHRNHCKRPCSRPQRRGDTRQNQNRSFRTRLRTGNRSRRTRRTRGRSRHDNPPGSHRIPDIGIRILGRPHHRSSSHTRQRRASRYQASCP